MKVLPIKGYEGLYEVSDNGRVFSHERKVKRKNLGKFDSYYSVKRKELKLHLTRNNYYRVLLSKNDKEKKELVHRLVAISFFLNPLNLPIVKHKDNNTQNNNWWNLEWATQANNIQQAHNEGRALGYPKGENHPDAKITNEIVLDIRNSNLPGRKLALVYGISEQSICGIRKKRTWKHI